MQPFSIVQLTRTRPVMTANRRPPKRGGLVGVAAVVRDVQQYLPANVTVPVPVDDDDDDDEPADVPAPQQPEAAPEVAAPEPVAARPRFGIALPGLGMFNPASVLSGLRRTGIALA